MCSQCAFLLCASTRKLVHHQFPDLYSTGPDLLLLDERSVFPTPSSIFWVSYESLKFGIVRAGPSFSQTQSNLIPSFSSSLTLSFSSMDCNCKCLADICPVRAFHFHCSHISSQNALSGPQMVDRRRFGIRITGFHLIAMCIGQII